MAIRPCVQTKALHWTLSDYTQTRLLSGSHFLHLVASLLTPYHNSVLRGLPNGELNMAIIMDHMDWFMPGSIEIEDEVSHLHRALKSGGKVLFRSAAKQPWYIDV